MRQSQAVLDRQSETTQTEDGQECPSYKSETVALRLVSRWMGNVGRSIRRAVATRTTARSSRRRLSRRWETEAFECRCLLSATALGGYVFEAVDYKPLTELTKPTVSLVNHQVIVGGKNANNDGEALHLSVVDGVFSNPTSLIFPSEWKKANPNDSNPSFSSVEGAFMGPDGIVYVLETATTSNANRNRVAFQSNDVTTLLDLNPEGQTLVVGVSANGELVLQSSSSYVSADATVTLLDGSGTFIPLVLEEFPDTGSLVAEVPDQNFSGTAQFWTTSGQMVPTYLADNSVHYEGIKYLRETTNGFIGIASIVNDEGDSADIVVTVISHTTMDT